MAGPKDERGSKKAPSWHGLMSKVKSKLSSHSSGKLQRDAKIDGDAPKAGINPPVSGAGQRSVLHNDTKPSSEPLGQLASMSVPIRDLWNQAYNDLRQKDRELIDEYEAALRENLTTAVLSVANIGREDQMKIVLKAKIEEVELTMWKLRFGSNEVPVKDLMAPLISIIDWANEYIGAAVSSNPYASIAWAGVGLLLPLLLNPSKQAASLAKGLEYVSGLIVQSSIREDLYNRRYELGHSDQSTKDFLPSHIGYRDTLKELYICILKFQATSVCYYSKCTTSRALRDMAKWDKWDSMLESIQTQEAAFQSVNELFKDTKYEEDCLVSAKRHEEGMSHLKSIGMDLSGLRKAVEKAEMDTQRNELLTWLSSVDPSENYNSMRDLHEPETSDWLVNDNKEFQDWKVAENSFLWLHGKAGSGKSVLSSSVIKHLRDLYLSDPNTAIGFFYLSFNDVKKQDTAGMLGSLIKQLCCRRPDTPQPLIDLGMYKKQGHRPDARTLETTLAATMHGFSRIYLVVDALDECPSGKGERMKLLSCLRRLLAVNFDNLHLFCTSRKETDIENVFASLLSSPSKIAIDLSNNKYAVSKDITLYIDRTLRTSDYHSWPDSIKVSARKALISKADGMFQYVSCQFDALRGLSSPANVQWALDNLPENLDSTYDRMLEQIDTRYWKQVANVLAWLAFSMRPLYLHELAEIFILNTELLAPLDETNRLFKPEEVLRHVPGVVTAPQISNDWNSVWYKSKIVEIQFAHFSIKEYLISKRMHQNLMPRFSITEATTHLLISNTCIAYHLQISSTELATKETVKRFALWEYAVYCWTMHLEQIDRRSWVESTINSILQVLEPKSQSLLNMLRIDNLHFNEISWELKSEDLPSPLYYTAALPTLNLAKLLISNGADINASGGIYGNALQAAARSGSTSTVQLLLDHGAEINASGGIHGNALQAAAADGNTSTVQLLLDHGADINASGGIYGNALQAAARSGNTSTVQLLLGYSADINASGGNYGDALQAAARTGYKSIIQLLLDHGADINASGGYFGNALQAAAYYGDTSIVQLLLDHGADINAKGGYLGNALQAAAFRGHTSNVQLLLDHGADINAKGGYYGNAFTTAVSEGHEPVVQSLLSRGADVNARGGDWGNALQAAVAHSDLDLIVLLLSRGAAIYPLREIPGDFSVRDNEGREEADRVRRFQEDPMGYLAKVGIHLPENALPNS